MSVLSSLFISATPSSGLSPSFEISERSGDAGGCAHDLMNSASCRVIPRDSGLLLSSDVLRYLNLALKGTGRLGLTPSNE
uniref:Putative secreted protein n=1 Tax=Ixodes ricinus TaxID=34613 RepID=A0A6B0U1D1_IXORI